MSLTSLLNKNKTFQIMMKENIPEKEQYKTNYENIKAFSKYQIIIPNNLENQSQSIMLGIAFDYLARFVTAQYLNNNKEDVFKNLNCIYGISILFDNINIKTNEEMILYNKINDYFNISYLTIYNFVYNNKEIDDDLLNSIYLFSQLEEIMRGNILLTNNIKYYNYLLNKIPENISYELLLMIKQFKFDFIESNILKRNSEVIFNPKFNFIDKIIGGADADIIIDNVLYDFKTTKQYSYKWKDCAQIYGYFLISKLENIYDIKRIALYKPRFGMIEYINIDDIDNDLLAKSMNDFVSFLKTYINL